MRSESPADDGVPARGLRPGERPSILPSFLLGVCLVSVAAAENNLPWAIRIDGEPLAAQWASIDERWEIVFQTASGPRTVNAAELVVWGKCSEADRGPWILLRDGGVAVGELRGLDREHLAAESRLFGAVRLPRASVAGLVLRLPGDRDGRDRLVDWVLAGASSARGGEASAEDRARLVNGDELRGALDRLADGRVSWRSGAEPLELEFDRVLAVRLGGAPPRAAEPPGPKPLIAWTGWRDGSRLLVASLATDKNAMRATLPDGTAWTAAAGDLTFLQPLGGRAVYLSDLKPEGYRHVPFLNLAWPFRMDRNAAGGLLRAGGSLYPKGLGMHSASRLTYLLTEPYRRFQAEAAVDDRTEGGGSVGFRVFVDGQVRYASPVVRGGQSPLPVSVDLSGARRLDLVVDFAERADELDHADWLNARLIR